MTDVRPAPIEVPSFPDPGSEHGSRTGRAAGFRRIPVLCGTAAVTGHHPPHAAAEEFDPPPDGPVEFPDRAPGALGGLPDLA